jgi:hypothetical protein
VIPLLCTLLFRPDNRLLRTSRTLATAVHAAHGATSIVPLLTSRFLSKEQRTSWQRPLSDTLSGDLRVFSQRVVSTRIVNHLV